MNPTSSITNNGTAEATPAPTLPKAPSGETLVRGALDDVALLFGGAVALHHLDDDLAWTLMKRLDRIRVRLFRDWKGIAPREQFEPSIAQPPRVHPAVEEFLFRNRVGMGE